MTYRLQQFEFDKSAYERPTQRWVCGWTEEGRPCQVGPDKHGRCRATFHCQPIKKGDRWHCTRSPNYGGPCEEGPRPDGACCRPIPPCQPVRSMRARRVLAVRLTIALTIALVVVVIFGPFGEDFISPGPLTAAHATTAESCRSCHSAAQDQAAAWIASAWTQHSASDDDHLCLVCHDAPKDASQPHSMALADLMQLRSPRSHGGADRSSGAGGGAGGGGGGEQVPWRLIAADRLVGDEALMAGQAACATCHREHHGRDQSLTHMNNEQCQACHAVQFDSFAHGHPEFSETYPHTRRTRIAFNHAKHAERLGHSSVIGPTGCSDCHVSDPTNRHMVLKGFDTSCSACHGKGVRSAGEVRFIELPSVDLDTIASAGLWIGRTDVGGWPRNTEGAETELSGILKLLLATDADRSVTRSIELLESRKVSLYNLSGADADTLQAAARIVWSLKGLMYDFAQGGELAIRTRFESLFSPGQAMTDSAFAALIGQPADAARQDEQTLAWNVKQAVTLWMPGLDEDVGAYRGDPERMTRDVGKAPPTPVPAPAKPAPAPPPAAKGSDELAPDDEQAPDEEARQSKSKAAADPNGLAPDDDEAPAAAGGKKPAAVVAQAASGSPAAGGNELAGDDDLASDDEPAGPATAKPAHPGAAPAPPPPPAAPPATTSSTPSKSAGTELTERAGRWHLRDSEHAIVYLPSGHADAFMRSWLDATAAPPRTSPPHADDAVLRRAADAVFRRLADRDTGPGRCGDCHSVDRPAGQDHYEVNWRGQRPESPEHSLTNFAHGPHFNRPELRSCQACHDYQSGLDPAVWRAAYGQYDPHRIAPNLAPITKSMCINCHTPDGAGDSCLMCHKYHRTEMAATPTSALLAEHRGKGEASQPRPGPDQK